MPSLRDYPSEAVVLLLALLLSFLPPTTLLAADPPTINHQPSTINFPDSLLASRATLHATNLLEPARTLAREKLWQKIRDEFPIPCDWLLQDAGLDFPHLFFAADAQPSLERKMLTRALAELTHAAAALRQEFDQLCAQEVPGTDPRWLNLYLRACAQRRTQRLQSLATLAGKIIFTKHRTIRPSFFAYTEGQSDAQHERHFLPGSELCLLELRGGVPTVRSLLKDPTGAIRDPAVSWDGTRVLFAWKKSLDEDDYHLYELDPASGRLRQLTFGLGFADYEPAYLPNGDLIFSSTRCVQTVDCWWTEASNLYTCDPNGRFLRRLVFDQVHSIFPQVLGDGRVIYTRWDYNDRGQVFPQALFQMNPDGTGQTEFYGNNSWFPTTIAHARGIPGTRKVLAIFCGHHTAQAGKLGVLDPARGRHENAGAQLVAPVRETKAERIDAYGQAGELFQYPYPLTGREFLVTYAPLGWERLPRLKGDADFGIYWMDLDGRRELLAADPDVPCQQPVPLVPRPRPQVQPGQVDYRKTNGLFYVQDVYAGAGLAGVPRGRVQHLRVVALEFRAAGVGANNSHGPGGGALASTPISIGNGSWDVKRVLGDATVRADGSAFFAVPARTPVYFQALDEKGRAIQTMRSWSTLQPGEVFACAGCHEHKNTAPKTEGRASSPSEPGNAAARSESSPYLTLALQAGPEALQPFYGPPRGFSFVKEIQPILDRHCVRCHHDRAAFPPKRPSAASLQPPPFPSLNSQLSTLNSDPPPPPPPSLNSQLSTLNSTPLPPAEPAFSLLGETGLDAEAKRRWSDSYLALVGANRQDLPWAQRALLGDYRGRLVNWIGAQSVPEPLPPYFAGATRSELPELLEQGHKGVRLSREERDKLNCWIDLFVPYCGEYTEAGAWTGDEQQKYARYQDKRRRMEALERQNIAALLSAQSEK
jgi:hypothetical protein